MTTSLSPAPWLLLQLADAAFPAGGFAHSSGLEAALHLGGDVDVAVFLAQTLRQNARSALPVVRAACKASADLAELAELDALFDATALSHVANRASRAQGRALASAAARIFDLDAIARYARDAPAHHAPIFGAVFGRLGLAPDDAATAFLHGTTRGVLSAAVRLGVLGPLEAQHVQHEAAPLLCELHASCTELADLAQTAPLLDLYGALHDRLDGRLFQS